MEASLARLSVLQRQLTAGGAAASSSPAAACVVADFCPKELYKYIVPDNLELRAQIFEFLKVGAKGPCSRLVPAPAPSCLAGCATPHRLRPPRNRVRPNGTHPAATRLTKATPLAMYGHGHAG